MNRQPNAPGGPGGQQQAPGVAQQQQQQQQQPGGGQPFLSSPVPFHTWGTSTIPAIVNKQFNSPIALYSLQNIEDSLSKHTEVLAPGVKGINFMKPEKPVNTHSAVFQAILEEEAKAKGLALPEGLPVSPTPPVGDHATPAHYTQTAVPLRQGFPGHVYRPGGNPAPEYRKSMEIKGPQPFQGPTPFRPPQACPQAQAGGKPWVASMGAPHHVSGPNQGPAQAQPQCQAPCQPQCPAPCQPGQAPASGATHGPGPVLGQPAALGLATPVSAPSPAAPATDAVSTGNCAECGRPIVGVFCRVNEKNLHSECFKCATCGTGLKNVGYFTVNDKLYCDIHAQQVAQMMSPGVNAAPVADATSSTMPTTTAQRLQQEGLASSPIPGAGTTSPVNQAMTPPVRQGFQGGQIFRPGGHPSPAPPNIAPQIKTQLQATNQRPVQPPPVPPKPMSPAAPLQQQQQQQQPQPLPQTQFLQQQQQPAQQQQQPPQTLLATVPTAGASLNQTTIGSNLAAAQASKGTKSFQWPPKNEGPAAAEPSTLPVNKPLWLMSDEPNNRATSPAPMSPGIQSMAPCLPHGFLGGRPGFHHVAPASPNPGSMPGPPSFMSAQRSSESMSVSSSSMTQTSQMSMTQMSSSSQSVSSQQKSMSIMSSQGGQQQLQSSFGAQQIQPSPVQQQQFQQQPPPAAPVQQQPPPAPVQQQQQPIQQQQTPQPAPVQQQPPQQVQQPAQQQGSDPNTRRFSLISLPTATPSVPIAANQSIPPVTLRKASNAAPALWQPSHAAAAPVSQHPYSMAPLVAPLPAQAPVSTPAAPSPRGPTTFAPQPPAPAAPSPRGPATFAPQPPQPAVPSPALPTAAPQPTPAAPPVPSPRAGPVIGSSAEGPAGLPNPLAIGTTPAPGQSIVAGSSAPRRGRGQLKPTPTPGTRIPICGTCTTSIRGPFIVALGNAWCPDHFLCANAQCKRSLQEVGFVEEKGQLYCEQCFEAYLAPICSKCNVRIKGDCLMALDKQWHPECFACSYCKKAFGNNSFYLEDGQPYCEKDWNELFTTKCVGCGFPIEAGDRWVEALNNNYHSQCFKCTVCHKNLEGQSFYAKGGRPYCKAHARG